MQSLVLFVLGLAVSYRGTHVQHSLFLHCCQEMKKQATASFAIRDSFTDTIFTQQLY